jgi:hypothetical protein
VRQCDVLVALIGRGWLTATDAKGRRRLDDPDDFVRLELESALANDVFVVPTSVQRAPLPEARDLPASLEPLARRQGTELRDTVWHDDVGRLIRQLERLVEERSDEAPPRARPVRARPRRRRRPLVFALAGAAAAGAAAAIAFTLGSGGSDRGSPKKRLLAAIPAITRPSCHSISYGEKSAEASLECAGAHLSVAYNLFASSDVMSGWYGQQRETVGIPPGSGVCTQSSFRGEGQYARGRYLCFVASGDEPTLVWTDTRTRVGAVANIYEGKGAAAAASLLRQWRCCLRRTS